MSRTTLSVGLGLSALASAGIAAYMSGRRAVPSWTGVVDLDFLEAPATVLRDQWGVPSVFAAHSSDAYRIQGWLHATDRPFQLDLLRRVGSGRLAEVVGEPGLDSDRLVHTLGLPSLAAQDLEMLDAEVREGLDAYAEGVNAGFARLQRRLPVEMRILRYLPDPWRPEHCMVLGRLLSLSLAGNWESELARGELIARFGPEVVAAIEGLDEVRAWSAQLDPAVLGTISDAARDATSTFGGPGGIGSNNWVIGPRRTRSGGALLANDPHLDLQLPSIWYEQRLQGGDLDVRGFTFPGTPGVVLGHNGRIAWGFTNSSIDVQDLYLETFDESGTRYLDVGGEWRDLEEQEVRIPVKGRPESVLRIRRTRRGPVITDVTPSTMLEQPVSMRWDSIRPNAVAASVYELNRAHDRDSFRSALSKWRSPAQNVVYADVHGNIGFQHVGEVPIRPAGNDGSVPRRGDDPDGEWIGTIPWEDQPTVWNPGSGRIVTANDRLVGDDYPHFLSREWMNGYRGERIRSLIDAIEGHTVGDQIGIQGDVYSIPGVRMRDALVARQLRPTTAAGQDILGALMSWDGELRPGTEESAAWRHFQRALQEQAFGFLGEWLPRFLGYSRTGVGGFWAMLGRSLPTLIAAIEEDDRTLIEAAAAAADRAASDPSLPQPLSGWTAAIDWDDAVGRALDRAGSWLTASQARLRSEPRTSPFSLPRRRRHHRLRLQHPLGVVPGFAQMANRGPFPVPGDADTVWQMSSFNNPLNDHAMVGPSHRHVVDLADLDRSVAIVCGGQSGHPASPHYADQVALWRRGEMRSAPFSREAIQRAARFTQRFVPAAR